MKHSNLALAALALTVSAFASQAHAVDRDFTVHNGIGITVATLQVSPSNVAIWGADLLGSSVLSDGAAVTIHYTPSMYRGQCVFDLRLVEADGDADVVRGVNLCTVTDVSFSRNAAGAVVYTAQ